MTWIEENKMDIFTAAVYSDQDKLLEFLSPGNGLHSDIIFFAVVMKKIEFLLVDLKNEWYDYYAVYLKNFTEEERMKIRDFFQLVRADQWLSANRLAISTDNLSNSENLCMSDYDLTDDGRMLDYVSFESLIVLLGLIIWSLLMISGITNSSSLCSLQ